MQAVLHLCWFSHVGFLTMWPTSVSHWFHFCKFCLHCQFNSFLIILHFRYVVRRALHAQTCRSTSSLCLQEIHIYVITRLLKSLFSKFEKSIFNHLYIGKPLNWYFYKQWRPRWNAATCGISSGSTLFVQVRSSEKAKKKFENYIIPLDVYNVISQVYCFKPEGRIH